MCEHFRCPKSFLAQVCALCMLTLTKAQKSEVSRALRWQNLDLHVFLRERKNVLDIYVKQ